MAGSNTTKVCRICKIEKDLYCYGKCKRNKDGLKSACKECRNLQNRDYVKRNPEKAKASWTADNRKSRERKAKWYQNIPKEERQRKGRQHYLENIERYKNGSSNYYKKNKKKCLSANKKYRSKPENKKRKCEMHKKRMQSDPDYRLRCVVGSRVRKAIKQNDYTFDELIGCSTKEFRLHLESLMSKCMSWSNYGTFWHVDHVMPLSAVDLNDNACLLSVANWRNCVPLKKKENLSKGSKVTSEAKLLYQSIRKELGF